MSLIITNSDPEDAPDFDATDFTEKKILNGNYGYIGLSIFFWIVAIILMTTGIIGFSDDAWAGLLDNVPPEIKIYMKYGNFVITLIISTIFALGAALCACAYHLSMLTRNLK